MERSASYITIARATGVTGRQDSPTAASGSVDQANTSANPGMSYAAYSLNGAEQLGINITTTDIERARIHGLPMALPEGTLSRHEVTMHHDPYLAFRQFAIAQWLCSHGNIADLKREFNEGGLSHDFYGAWADWRTGSYAIAASIMESYGSAPIPIALNDPYYFAPVAQMLKANTPEKQAYAGKIVGVNHITFPSLEDLGVLDGVEGIAGSNEHIARLIFEPWLSFDEVCFHTQADIDRFLSVMSFLFPGEKLPIVVENPIGINVESVEKIASEVTPEDENRILQIMAENAQMSVSDFTQLLSTRTALICVGNRVDPIKNLHDLAAMQDALPDLNTITVIQARMNRAESPSYRVANEKIAEASRNANLNKPHSVVHVDSEFSNIDVIKMSAVIAKYARDVVVIAPPGVEGMSMSCQESLIAASTLNAKTGFVSTTGLGIGFKLHEFGVKNVIQEARPGGAKLAEAVRGISNMSPENRIALNNQIQSYMRSHDLNRWIGQVNRMLELST